MVRKTIRSIVIISLTGCLVGCLNPESEHGLVVINIEENVKNVKPLYICDFNGELRYIPLRGDAGQEKFKAILFDETGKTVRTAPNHIFLNKKQFYTHSSNADADIYKLGGKLHFTEVLNDTLFLVNDQFEFQPLLVSTSFCKVQIKPDTIDPDSKWWVSMNTISVETMLLSPDSILADPDRFWATDSAYMLADNRHLSTRISKETKDYYN